MDHRNKIKRKRLQTLASLLVIAALLLLPGAGSASGVSEAPALVRLNLPADAAGQERLFETLELLAYGRFYLPEGGSFLLLEASAAQQEALRSSGHTLEVLDQDVRNASYYRLYGLPDALKQAALLGQVLYQQDRTAIARISPELAGAVAELGIQVLPLRLRALPVAESAPGDSASQELTPALPEAITPDPLVSEMISRVTSERLHQLNGDLSGEWSTIIDGAAYTLATRNTNTSTAIKKATKYAYDYFLSEGLPTAYQYYYLSGTQKRNVIAEQIGLTQPERIFLLVGHLDSTSPSPYTLAPGADDNASGSTGVLLAADILSEYKFGCTLRYVLFTGEEQGLYGSENYATYVYNQGEDIEGVLNLDMIAYNSPGSLPRIELHTRPNNSGDLAFANLFSSVVTSYGMNLTPRILQDAESFSDHASFWDRGYPAILAIEDWTDHTPYYHTTNDQLESLEMSYYTNFTKASLATFAHMGCLLEGRLSGKVTDASSNKALAGALVKATDENGKMRSITTGQDGLFSFALPPGVYSLAVSAAGMQSGALQANVNDSQITTQNVALQPEAPQNIKTYVPLVSYSPAP